MDPEALARVFGRPQMALRRPPRRRRGPNSSSATPTIREVAPHEGKEEDGEQEQPEEKEDDPSRHRSRAWHAPRRPRQAGMR
jgi:hypothetical protein